MSRWRCFRFSVVGAMGIAVQLAMLWLLTRVAGLDYLLATGLAVESAVLHNFLWHQRYTWPDRGIRGVNLVVAALARFHMSAGLISIGGNLVCMRLLVGAAHLPVLPSNLVSIAVCWILNFLVSDRWVFRSPSGAVVSQARAPFEKLRAGSAATRFRAATGS